MTRGAALISDLATQARDWLFEAAFPLWAGAGFDAHTGLFVESLDRNGAPSGPVHRVRVQARQTYVFMEAGRLGWSGEWREFASAGLATLLGPSRAGQGAAGFSIDPSGVLVDPRRELYDQAFALFGLAHARALDPAAVDRRAAEILAYLETRRSTDGGYLEADLPPAPRRQNPHMHLLEAGLVMMRCGMEGGVRLVDEVANLFGRAFYQLQSQSLPEDYTADWRPLSGDPGNVAEPGHHCEWIWLLDQLRREGGPDFRAQSDGLWAHAVTNGLRNGVLVDEVFRTGGQKTQSARLWPQTERLKAALVRWEHERTPERLEDIRLAFDGLFGYLAATPHGSWFERKQADGSFTAEAAPASSLYHVTCAFSELLRIAAAT